MDLYHFDVAYGY